MTHSANDTSRLAMPASAHPDYDETQIVTPVKQHTNNDEPRAAMRSTKRPGFLGLLVRAALPLGILAVGTVAYSILSVEPEEAKSPPVEEQAIRTRVTELRVQDYPVVIKTHGIVQPHNQVTLSAQVSGQITRVSPAFEVGSYFAEGDVLVELDNRDYVTAVAVAEARHLGAESALELAIENHERNVTLYGKNGVSEAVLKQSFAIRAQAEAELDSTAAQLEQAKRDLERTKILAPFDGRVREKSVGLGQLVSLGTTLGVVFAVDFAEVRLPISGQEQQFLDLPELASDAPVAVELRDGISESSPAVWQGQIIRTEGVLDENSLELFAIARVDDPFGRMSGQPPLRIEQPVVASITGKTLTDVVAIPRGAVRQLDQVLLVDKTELTLIPQTIDPIWSDEEHVIVQASLIKNGELLSTTHLVYAPDGAKVEIIRDMEVSATAVATTTSAQDD